MTYYILLSHKTSKNTSFIVRTKIFLIIKFNKIRVTNTTKNVNNKNLKEILYLISLNTKIVKYPKQVTILQIRNLFYMFSLSKTPPNNALVKYIPINTHKGNIIPCFVLHLVNLNRVLIVIEIRNLENHLTNPFKLLLLSGVLYHFFANLNMV